jgi:hypothetical protein
MYKVFVTDAYYIAKDNTLEWANEVDKTIGEFESKKVEEHETLAEALESVNNWGSRWVLYSGLIIENEEGEEVYSDISALYKCECCGNEVWERTISDMRTFKRLDGSIMFPDIK